VHNGIARLAGGDTCSAADRVCVSFALHDCCCTSIRVQVKKSRKQNMFFCMDDACCLASGEQDGPNSFTGVLHPCVTSTLEKGGG